MYYVYVVYRCSISSVKGIQRTDDYDGNKNKAMNMGDYKELDAALYIWFQQQ